MSQRPDLEFAPIIAQLGRGQKGNRDLSPYEAYRLMKGILDFTIKDVQLGAAMMLLRAKEESATEIAAMSKAWQEYIPELEFEVDFDWPSYAGKRRHPPYFVLAQVLLAQKYTLVCHGYSAHTAGRFYTEEVYRQLGLPIADTWPLDDLPENKPIYLPVELITPAVARLFEMKKLLGLRTPIHSISRVLNPARAHTSIQSVFHRAYADRHCAASAMMEHTNSVAFKGEGGEAEIRLEADVQLKRQHSGTPTTDVWERSSSKPKPKNLKFFVNDLRAAWHEVDGYQHAIEVIIHTAAVALSTHKQCDRQEALEEARALWQSRDLSQFTPK